MIDSVLKGTGNSRFLKSAVPAGTSWADALAMLQAGTFPIDFNGINTEGFQQVGTPLNKANLLKDATAAQIGLPPSTTPDGMFQALGNTGELHVWRKKVVTTEEKPAGYTLGDAESGTAFSIPNAGSQNYVTLQYGPSITVNDAGGVSLTSVTGSVQFQQYSDVSAIYDIRNNFVKAIPNGGSTSAFDGVIFVPNDCSFKNTAGIVTFGKFYRVNAYPLTPAGTTTTYPVSTNPNAYQEGDDAKAAGYVLGDVKTGSFLAGGASAMQDVYWNYSDSLNVSDDGTLTLKNADMANINTGNSSSLQKPSVLLGKFAMVTNGENYLSGSPFAQKQIVYIPSNAVVSGMYIDRYQPVTGYAAIPASTTIEYLGKLGDKARVQFGSYVGTGTFGETNPNTLNLSFTPRFLLVMNGNKPTSRNTYANFALFVYGVANGITVGPSSANYEIPLYATWNEKSISWYNSNSDYGSSGQMNNSGTKYRYVVIG